jgi:excisionase family DNA binding protein
MHLLTAREVATLLRVGRSTLYDLMKNHSLPRPLKLGGSRRWREDEVLAWRDARDEMR